MATLSDVEVQDQLKGLSGWRQQGDAIAKSWTFEDFKHSLAFVNRVAELAEKLDHHPDILIQYDRVTLTLTSHDSGGLTSRDLRLASQIEGLGAP